MKAKKRKIKQKSHGFHNQQEIFVISLRNDNGMRLRVTNFAATIMSLDVPNPQGELVNVVVGYKSIEDYINKSKNKESKFLGASIGRYAGRISNEKVKINDTIYPLYHEDGVHLHGGKHGFDERIWAVDYVDEDEMLISFSYQSKHLEEGYPGNLRTKVIYQLTKDNKLKITYQAVSDHDTLINLTNHAYYNLNGAGTINNHSLKLNSSYYLEVDEKQLPTGVLKPVLGTKFDFNTPKKLTCLEKEGVIDDTFVVDKYHQTVAELASEESGIVMKVTTNQPGVVIYTPKRFPDWSFRKKAIYNTFPAICFETQNFPDAPNHSGFPSSFLKAGKHYKNQSIFSFSLLE